ncbi:hypothetical protein QE152_g15890 [Popillia japonica]|uniref:Uncharacterized protein n=1 Tax=Popillia japonica TaxID=7064 RepID=A0AAW1L6K5_POPJA
MNIIRAVEYQAEIGILLSKARMQDIKDRQNVNGTQKSQLQLFEDESSDSYWASTPQHSTTSGRNSQYSYVDLLSTSQATEATQDILSQAMGTILQ